MLPNLEEFRISAHDRFEEIWTLHCFFAKSVLWRLTLFCHDLRAITWEKISKNCACGEKRTTKENSLDWQIQNISLLSLELQAGSQRNNYHMYLVKLYLFAGKLFSIYLSACSIDISSSKLTAILEDKRYKSSVLLKDRFLETLVNWGQKDKF